MTKEEIMALYKAWILPESKDPFHFEKQENCQHTILAYNPLCGDKFELYLRGEHPYPLDTVGFHGIGCAVSTASTSLMLRHLQSKTLQEALIETAAVLAALAPDADIQHLPEKIKVLASTKHFGGRVDCIRLSWQALYDYLLQIDSRGQEQIEQ
jgi:nitrogen fixation NifU-like protein